MADDKTHAELILRTAEHLKKQAELIARMSTGMAELDRRVKALEKAIADAKSDAKRWWEDPDSIPDSGIICGGVAGSRPVSAPEVPGGARVESSAQTDPSPRGRLSEDQS